MLSLERSISILKQADFLGEQIHALEALQEHLSKNELIVSVIGQFKRGKSSLINALLGQQLLPVGIIPLTAVVTELRYAPEVKILVHFLDGAAKSISAEELADYCTEERNSKNQKQVRKIQVWTPHQPFGNGIVLVDTPGVGSIHQHNTESSLEYIRQSDAVIFMLSVDSPVSETERAFLLECRAYASKFFFVVNKSDTVSGEDLQTFLNFCGTVLAECMQSEVALRPISVKTMDHVADLLMEVKTQLSGEKDCILQASAAHKAELVLQQARAKISAAIHAASLPRAELQVKLERIAEEQETLAGFSEEIQVLARHRTDRLIDQIAEQMVQQTAALSAAIKQTAEQFYAENAVLSPAEFEQEIQKTVNDALQNKLQAMNTFGLELLEHGYHSISGLLCKKAYDAACFIANLMKSEFDTEYPVEEKQFTVTDQSDFILHLGIRGTLLMDTELLTRFLPHKKANERFLRRTLQQAADDIDSNRNNMLSNYRYKMQESLRPMCRELSAQVGEMAADVAMLAQHLRSTLDNTEQIQKEQTEQLEQLLHQLNS